MYSTAPADWAKQDLMLMVYHHTSDISILDFRGIFHWCNKLDLTEANRLRQFTCGFRKHPFTIQCLHSHVSKLVTYSLLMHIHTFINKCVHK